MIRHPTKAFEKSSCHQIILCNNYYTVNRYYT